MRNFSIVIFICLFWFFVLFIGLSYISSTDLNTHVLQHLNAHTHAHTNTHKHTHTHTNVNINERHTQTHKRTHDRHTLSQTITYTWHPHHERVYIKWVWVELLLYCLFLRMQRHVFTWRVYNILSVCSIPHSSGREFAWLAVFPSVSKLFEIIIVLYCPDGRTVTIISTRLYT